MNFKMEKRLIRLRKIAWKIRDGRKKGSKSEGRREKNIKEQQEYSELF